MDGFRRSRRACAALLLIAGVLVASALGAQAATTPTLTLKLTSVDDVKVSWAFDALPTRNGSAIEVQRSLNGGAYSLIKRASRPRPTGSFTDSNVPSGLLSYRARLVVDGTAHAWGALKLIAVGTSTTTPPTTAPPTTAPPTTAPPTTVAPTTTAAPTTTVAPTTTTTSTTTTAPPPPTGSPGAHRWTEQVGGRYWYQTAVIEDVAVAPNGTTIAVGYFDRDADFGRGMRTAVGGNDAFVVAFDANGNALWDRTLGSTGFDRATGVSVGPNGQIAVVGFFQATATTGSTQLSAAGGSDGFVLSLNGSGALLWASPIGGVSGDAASSVAVGNSVTVTGTFNGSAAIAGRTLTSAGATDLFVADFALANGAPQWASRYGTGQGESAPDIAVDSADRAVITGYTNESQEFKIFAAQYRGDTGAQVWSRVYGTGVGAEVAIAPNDDIVLAGLVTGSLNLGGGTLGPSAASDMFVARLGSNGTTHVWSKMWTNVAPFQYSDIVGGVAVDGAGDVVLTGSVIGSMNFGGGITLGGLGRDPVIIKLAGSTGAYKWARRLLALDGEFNTATGIAIAPGNDVVAAGVFMRRIRIADGVELTAADGTNARTDSYVSRFAP